MTRPAGRRKLHVRKATLACTAIIASATQAIAPAPAAGPPAARRAGPLGGNDLNTTTPIKHVIVIYGENRAFDHLFGTYRPKDGHTVDNIFAKGIVNKDGSPGPSFAKATQFKATETDTYRISPAKTGAYETLPPPNTGGTPRSARDTAPPPFATIAAAENADYGLLPRDLRLLTTGASGLPRNSIDTRIRNVNALPSGPFQLTPGVSDDTYAASPVHRFYQSWQQSDCSVQQASADNPSGCLSDLFPWVEVSVGEGSDGKPPAAPLDDQTTHEGAIAMGFYNVLQGDNAYFKQLADRYAMSDNYHQPAMGGTGLNSIFAGFADAIWYSDGRGNVATPPDNRIENPDPQPGTNNFYKQDGYSGGSYSACADTSQPGVNPIVDYLSALPAKIKPNCDPGHYYLMNNCNPGYFGDGTVATDAYAIPPSPTRSIGDVLLEGNTSFRWYGEGWTQYVSDPNSSGKYANPYCNICNPFLYQTSIMTNEMVRQTVIQDTSQFYTDLQDGVLPAVSFVKPGGLNDGHPTSSKWTIFEAFTKKILLQLAQHSDLWKSAAVFITVDEGGGYWDSGYIQPFDFFGDGPRIPLIVVSPYSTGGRVVHSYGDHVSILKFIEANWGLKPISGRSRDNLPNPVHNPGSYVPENTPALGDLIDMFDFSASASRDDAADGVQGTP